MTLQSHDPTTPPDDRPNTVHWPPILYVATLLDAAVLQYFVPLGSLVRSPVDILIGGPLALLGLAIGVVALIRFRIVGTSFDPTARAKALATGGIYRISRNPMYLGVVMTYVGLGLALRRPWLVIMALPMAVALHVLAIRREEAYLERRFGDDYRAYKAKVRRWI